jgi:Immunity protein 49
MDLSYVRTLLVKEARLKLASLATDEPIDDKALTLRDLSRLFQGVGICRLMIDADVEKFRENLVRSGQARQYYLRHARSENSLHDRFLGLSRVDAVFDAIVAADMNLVRRIVSLSIEEWHEGWEYEDDFCYYLFAHRLATEADFIDQPAAELILDRFERALEGQSSSRLDLCRAIHQQRRPELRQAFEALLSQRQSDLDKKRPAMTEYTAQAIFWPQSFVWIEGLAWLAMAKSVGLDLDGEFQFCPAEARTIQGGPEVEDFFVSLDRALKGG